MAETLEVGRCYLFTDSTAMIYVGRLTEIVGPHTVTIEDAAWVSVTGRLSEFVRTGVTGDIEIEPVGARGLHWVGWTPWPHKLFREAV
jgi:hypothetical protein